MEPIYQLVNEVKNQRMKIIELSHLTMNQNNQPTQPEPFEPGWTTIRCMGGNRDGGRNQSKFRSAPVNPTLVLIGRLEANLKEISEIVALFKDYVGLLLLGLGTSRALSFPVTHCSTNFAVCPSDSLQELTMPTLFEALATEVAATFALST